MPSNKPISYRPARLVVPGKNAKKQLLTVVAWIYDINKGKKARVQFNYFNNNEEYPTDEDKLAEANKLIARVNAKLEKGGVMDSSKPKSKQSELMVEVTEKTPLVELLFKISAGKSRLRDNTTETYEHYIRKFIVWLKKHGPYFYEDFKMDNWEKFQNYLLNNSRIKSNRSLNNYLNTISIFFNDIDKKIGKKLNPLKDITKLPEDEGRNIAFTDMQVNQLMEYMSKNCPEMLLPCKLMFYTYMRTNELTRLKIGQIEAYQPNQIYLQPSHSKSRNNRYAVIPPDLKRELDKFELHKYPKDYYLLGDASNMRPGVFQLSKNALSQKFRRRVLDPLGFDKDYTFYSWKHTGVIWAKLKGNIPDASIILQGGWRDWHSFTKYLKSLGLMDNSDFATKMPSLPEY